MSDLISRQAAIDAADGIIHRDDSGSNIVVEVMKAWKTVIEGLPSAEPERKPGKWITLWDAVDHDTSTTSRCSACGRISQRPLGDFCRWCGADMKGEISANSD